MLANHNENRTLYLIVIISILVLTSFLFSGCDKKSAELKLMLENPAVNMQLTTAQEIKRLFSDREKTLGKPIYPEVIVNYEPIGNFSREDVFNEIVKNLKQNDWMEKLAYSKHQNWFVAISHRDPSLIIKVLYTKEDNIIKIYLERH